ncbi:MAG: hypothetical protein IIX36_03070, partial [Clostridia bacterium]|nr:hypothetical protein [Clostridia bacterium]
VSQEVIIRQHDCGTTGGIWVGAVYDKNGDVIDTFGNRIRGRYPVNDVCPYFVILSIAKFLIYAFVMSS